MEFEGCKFKYENDKLYRLFKNNKWKCCNDLVCDNLGYIRVKVNNKMYLLHRLIYKLHNPNWNIYDNTTNNSIDHIDRNPRNNKIQNLRVLTHQQNAFNAKAKGYSYDVNRNKYYTRIIINNKSIFLGYCNTAEEAHNKYIEAKKLYHVI